jgi:hypothetical protein
MVDNRADILQYLEDCPDDIKQYINGILLDIETVVDKILGYIQEYS